MTFQFEFFLPLHSVFIYNFFPISTPANIHAHIGTLFFVAFGCEWGCFYINTQICDRASLFNFIIPTAPSANMHIYICCSQLVYWVSMSSIRKSQFHIESLNPEIKCSLNLIFCTNDVNKNSCSRCERATSTLLCWLCCFWVKFI